MNHKHRNLPSLSLQDPTAHRTLQQTPLPPLSQRNRTLQYWRNFTNQIHAEPDGTNSCGTTWGQSCELLGDQALLAIVSSLSQAGTSLRDKVCGSADAHDEGCGFIATVSIYDEFSTHCGLQHNTAQAPTLGGTLRGGCRQMRSGPDTQRQRRPVPVGSPTLRPPPWSLILDLWSHSEGVDPALSSFHPNRSL